MAYTSLHLYRPGNPPQVSTHDVARFLEEFEKMNLVAPARLLIYANIKYGGAIDTDAQPTYSVEPTIDGLGLVKEIDWDVSNRELVSIQEIRALLLQNETQFYRCNLGLGGVSKTIIDPLHRSGGEEPLYLNGWGFTLGPVTSYDYQKVENYVIGWIGITLSGYGSLYPWKPKDIVERAEKLPQLKELRNLCRSTWPVEAKPPDLRVQHLREQMGDLWPYERIDKPLDWYWGVG